MPKRPPKIRPVGLDGSKPRICDNAGCPDSHSHEVCTRRRQCKGCGSLDHFWATCNSSCDLCKAHQHTAELCFTISLGEDKKLRSGNPEGYHRGSYCDPLNANLCSRINLSPPDLITDLLNTITKVRGNYLKIKNSGNNLKMRTPKDILIETSRDYLKIQTLGEDLQMKTSESDLETRTLRGNLKTETLKRDLNVQVLGPRSEVFCSNLDVEAQRSKAGISQGGLVAERLDTTSKVGRRAGLKEKQT